MRRTMFMGLTVVKSKYKLLLEYFRVILWKIRSFALLVCQSRRLLQPTAPVPEIQHLTFSLPQSMGQVIINKDIDKKIKEGYFADRLVIVAALPKSASSVIGSCIAAIQSKSGVGVRGYARYMLANQDPDLRPELVQDFLQGGVLKFHPRATGKNLKVLDLLGVKYVILLRHPVDHLVARYCHVLDGPLLKDAIRKDSWIYDSIYPLDYRLFQDGVNLDDTIQYMINEGYLSAVLSWIADWLRFRDVNRSLVLRYEDFIRNRDQTLNNISHFLYARDLDKKTLMKCNSVAERLTTEQSEANNTRKYPRGWTGKIGIWKSYFSEGNKRSYLSVVKGFLDYYPNASLVLEVYPKLLDIDNL
jgi:hypothetical protein